VLETSKLIPIRLSAQTLTELIVTVLAKLNVILGLVSLGKHIPHHPI
jgi:hypothetical protein